jgi:signal transduction histidine kinase
MENANKRKMRMKWTRVVRLEQKLLELRTECLEIATGEEDDLIFQNLMNTDKLIETAVNHLDACQMHITKQIEEAGNANA